MEPQPINTNQPTTITQSTQPTQPNINWQVVKKYATRIISIALIINGLKEIGLGLYEIFTYTNATQTGVAIAETEFKELLKVFLVDSVRASVESVYGFILLFKPSEKIKLFHIAIGVAIFLLPFLITDKFLNQVNQLLPSVKIEVSQTLAQETPLSQAISDYQFQFQKYREAHAEYLSAKNAFLSFDTLNSRTNAIEKTRVLLQLRAEVIRSYLFALRIALRNAPGVSQNDLASFSDQLAAQETFLTNYQDTIQNLTSLESVSQTSNELQSRYPSIQILSYNTLLTILQSEQSHIATNLETQRQNLDELIQEASNSALNITQISQWLSDTQSTLNQNAGSYEAAQELLTKLRPNQKQLLSNQRIFSKILKIFQETKQNLLTVTDFLKETLTLVKYG